MRKISRLRLSKRVLTAFSTIAAGLTLFSSVALAAPGNPVQPPINPPGPSGTGCNGIGVAFDGSNILYTCANEAAVRITNLAGANLGSVATADTLGNPVSVDAIAWDPTENKLWGGDLDSANNTCRIWSIDMGSGLATMRFSFSDPHGGCNLSFFDGLTVDTVTNTLWLSPDIHRFIHHYQKNGTEIAADLISFSDLTVGQCPVAQGFGNNGCWNSGLTIGLDGNLFAGTNGDGKIFQVKPGPPASILGQFATVSGRDEDLECGPVVNTLETILSRDFITGHIDVLEAPKGTCKSPVVPQITLDPKLATNPVGGNHTVTATVTASGQPVANVLVSFNVVVGPNAGQVSDPGECSTDPNCHTDASGKTSWTYTSNGTVGVDVIEACFTDKQDQRHCDRVKKEWVDRTPPRLACTETVNPHGKNVPPAGNTTLPGPKGGQNEDGFYQLFGKDNVDPTVQIFVTDSSGSGPFGPFASGDNVKITQAPGASPSSKPMGSSNGQAGAIVAHITLKGDALVTATDSSGNKATVSCLVPPPPK